MTELAFTREQIDATNEMAERAAREAVASLCGLVLRRLQEEHPSRSMERNAMEDVLDERLSEIFGEALQQFTKPARDSREFER